jgi:hypothetical protein
LRRVNACVLVVPVVMLPNVMLVGVMATCGETPVPLSVIGEVPVPELLVNATEPVTAPALAGANTTDPAVLCPAARVSGRVNPVTL